MNVGVRELRDGLSRYLTAVRGGAEVTVTDHGKPVARLVPYAASGSGLEQVLAPVVLREIQARAETRGVTVDCVLSELAELGIAHSAAATPRMRNGVPVMSAVPGHVITDELVAQYRDDL